MKVDASEFRGSVEALSKILERKLQTKIATRNNILQIDDNLSKSEVRGALKHALHKLEPQHYRVIGESDGIKIRKVECHLKKTRPRDWTPPSAPQTLPHYFPGR